MTSRAFSIRFPPGSDTHRLLNFSEELAWRLRDRGLGDLIDADGVNPDDPEFVVTATASRYVGEVGKCIRSILNRHDLSSDAEVARID